MADDTNQKVLPNSNSFIDQMKYEVAGELGITNYDAMDKGSLTSRDNGYIGGNITKRLVALGQQSLMNQGQQAINQTQQIGLETTQQTY
ncbi:MAG: alpha/beta-type small acid-soluble spore protein [Clostridiales bacterium]|nr:alpha/beta-type small acid-soluble spore protein [Clostridiales bacterium]MCF8021639.1 alpha/beta-type small acid-soluble spore protein [Clostridiales bacterium]